MRDYCSKIQDLQIEGKKSRQTQPMKNTAQKEENLQQT